MAKFEKAARVIKKGTRTVKKYLPDILAGFGVVGVGVGFVTGCKAAVNSSKIIDETGKEIDRISTSDIPEEEAGKQISTVKKQCRRKVVKEFVKPVGLTVGGTICFLSSNGILRKKAATYGAALTSITNTFGNYRKGVVERFGEAVDKDIILGRETKEVEETVTDPVTGEQKTVKKTVNVRSPKCSDDMYVFRFDSSSPYWNKFHMDYNLKHLMSVEAEAGYDLYLNDVTSLDDIIKNVDPKQVSAVTKVTGWVNDKSLPAVSRQRQISLGINWEHPEENIFRDTLTGEDYILFSPNVDGSVIEWYDIPRHLINFSRDKARKGGINGTLASQLMDCQRQSGIMPEDYE